MATVSYSLVNKVPAFLANTSVKAGTQTDPVAFGLSAGTYVSLWSTPNPSTTDVDANTLNALGTSASSGEFRANATDDVTGNQFDPAVTQITSGPNAGKILVTYTDTNSVIIGDIRLAQLNSAGTAQATSTLVWHNDQFGKADSAISALSNGGFAVTFTRVTFAGAGASGTDLVYQAYDSNLNPLGLNFVDSVSEGMGDSTVAGLTGGWFVVAWEQTPDGGGAKTVWFQLYNNAGTATGVDGTHPDGTHVQIGSATSTAVADIQAKALTDGGFVTAYVANHGTAGNDIVAQIFNPNGTSRTSTFNVNTTTTGDQDKPSIAILTNGLFAVSWTDEATHKAGYRVFDSNGNGGTETFLDSNVVKNSITTLTNGLIASVFESTTSEPGGSGDSMQSSLQEVARTTTGTQAVETITGDALRDIINGGGGNDTMTGGANADTFVFTTTSGNGPTLTSGSVITDYDRGNSGSYSAAEGDVIDLSAFLSGPYNHGSGLPLASIVRVANIGGTVLVQVNVNDATNNWQTATSLQNIVVGNKVGVLVDSSLAPFTLTVESPPVLSSSFVQTSVLENTTAVTTIHATDPDAGDTLTYLIRTVSNDGAQFQIDPSSGVLSFKTAPDFENPTDGNHDNVYNVTVRVSDGHQTTDVVAQVTVIDDVRDTPTITSNGGGDAATVSIAENMRAVTTVAATDPEAGATLAYSITGGTDAAKFQINSASGVLSFVTAPDFETPADTDHNNSYLVQVRASDGTLFDDQSITVNVSNVTEAPLITSNGGGDAARILVLKNATAVTTVTAEPDTGTTLAYSIVGGADAGKFQINSLNGALSFITAPDIKNPTDADHNNSYVVQVSASDGVLSDTQTITVNPHDVAVTHDFNQDGTSDILWRNSDTGAVRADLLQNGQYQSTATVGQLGSEWQVKGTGDFNGDGTSDILWRNTNTGAVRSDLLHDGQYQSTATVGQLGAEWQVQGVGDFNGDGTSDILWRNSNTGAVRADLLHNGQYQSTATVGQLGAEWQVAGVGDFNGDGTSDILWRNSNTGAVRADLLQNGQYQSTAIVGQLGAEWQVQGIGDFNGDGTSDILWRNINTGAVRADLLKDGHYQSTATVGQLGSEWQVAGTGDFNGDGTSDILWHNSNTGTVRADLLHDGNYDSTSIVGQLGHEWIIS